MELSRERERGQDDPGEHEAPSLESEEHGREEERDQPEEVPGRLADPIGHQAEDDAADESGRGRDAERT